MKRKSLVEKHFDNIAEDYTYYKQKQKFYYSNLMKLVSDYIPTNKEIFEVGCGTGHMLVSLNPKFGYGYDISSEMINIAKKIYMKNKKLYFSVIWPPRKFDYIFMCDVIEHLENPSQTFTQIAKSMNKKSLFVCTMANPIWEPLLILWEKLGLKMPEGKHYRMTFKEIRLILKKCGLKVKDHGYRLLVPIKIPLITELINKYFGRLFNKLSFIEYFVVCKE
jgi:hypothetical protein